MSRLNTNSQVSLIVFDCGEYPAPASLIKAWPSIPKRLVTLGGCYTCGEGSYVQSLPDSRTPEGAAYYRWERAENKRCYEAHMTGAPFTPNEYPLP